MPQPVTNASLRAPAVDAAAASATVVSNRMTPDASTPLTADEQWPAVKRAYDFVLPSYQAALTRFEAADGRLTFIIGHLSTVTLAAPAFARVLRPDISFAAVPFLAAMACAGVAAYLAVVARLRGRVTIPNPGRLFDPAHRESEWEFQRNAVYFAGKHLEENQGAIARKSEAVAQATALLFAEVFALV